MKDELRASGVGWNGSGGKASPGAGQTRPVKPKSRMVAWALAIVSIVAVAWFLLPTAENPKGRRQDPEERNTRAPKNDIRTVVPKTQLKAKVKSPRTRLRVVSAIVDDMTEEDRKLTDAVQAALDEDDFKATREAVLKALKSGNSEVRSAAVDALGWFGDKALVELTQAMADKDAGVAESARDHVENALMGMEDNDRAFVLAAEYIKLFPNNDEARTMFSGILTSAGNSIIDPDDADSAESVAKAKGNRAGIVDIVSEMIGMGGDMAREGREIYESISGEEWSDRTAADKWADDIEEPASDSGGN